MGSKQLRWLAASSDLAAEQWASSWAELLRAVADEMLQIIQTVNSTVNCHKIWHFGEFPQNMEFEKSRCHSFHPSIIK